MKPNTTSFKKSLALICFIFCASTSLLNAQNAQVEILSNTVKIGSENNPQMVVNTNGSVTIGSASNPRVAVNPDGTVKIGNGYWSQMVVDPNGYIGIGNQTDPHIKVVPSKVQLAVSTAELSVGLNGIHLSTANNIHSLTNGISLTMGSQRMEINDDVISIGNEGNPQIQIYNNGAVHVGKTSVPPDPFAGFEVNVPHTFIKAPLPVNGYVGFHFGAGVDISESGRIREVMVLTGLHNQRASIGRSDNQMNEIYSSEYYLSGAALGPLVNSDANLKTNVRELPLMTERISKLRPVMYDFVRDGSGEDVSKDPAYKNRVGFIAQEVKELFPDLVTMYKLGEDKDVEELLSLDYAGLIPYLTKAIQEQKRTIQELNTVIQDQGKGIQEQNRKIETLQLQINDIQTGSYFANFDISTPKQQTVNDITHILHQNVPNPFSSATTITYQLAENATNAKICIYNLTDKQLQCYNLPTTKGENAIEVRASSLQSGMYLYSLIVDGKLIDTKRMILTE
ncbi:MAG: tail fiber domain-containing protein [Bacteroidales bacterium]|nr:tail fiber domain-containing protein [Bacteroidales bacterium]